MKGLRNMNELALLAMPIFTANQRTTLHFVEQRGFACANWTDLHEVP